MITPGSIQRAKERAVGGRKDRCSIGKSCSATCIQGVKVCLVDLPDAVSASMVKFKSLVDRKIRTVGSQAQKVLPGIRGKYLAGRNEKYNAVQGKLVKQIERASLRGDQDKANSLSKKLNRLQEGVGAKLKAPKVEPKVDEAANTARRAKYYKVKDSLIGKMSEAGRQGKRGTYEKWEKTLLNLEKKAAGKFGDTELTKKGDGWKFTSRYRKENREGKLNTAINLKHNQVRQAAREGDFKKYRQLEDSLIKMADKANEILGINYKVPKNKIWRTQKERGRDRERELEEKMFGKAIRAIGSNDRGQYDKIEKRFKNLTDSGALSSPSYFRQGGNMWKNYQGVAHFATRLEDAGIKKGREGVSDIKLKLDPGDHEITINSKVNGNNLKLQIHPDSFSFMVNNGYLASDYMSRTDKVAVVREVQRQFDAVFKSIGEGTVFTVVAARGDGREDMREGAYKKAGFSSPDRYGNMFGQIVKGKMIPIDEDEFNDAQELRFVSHPAS
jgi:hypothetical protein